MRVRGRLFGRVAEYVVVVEVYVRLSCKWNTRTALIPYVLVIRLIILHRFVGRTDKVGLVAVLEVVLRCSEVIAALVVTASVSLFLI